MVSIKVQISRFAIIVHFFMFCQLFNIVYSNILCLRKIISLKAVTVIGGKILCQSMWIGKYLRNIFAFTLADRCNYIRHKILLNSSAFSLAEVLTEPSSADKWRRSHRWSYCSPVGECLKCPTIIETLQYLFSALSIALLYLFRDSLSAPVHHCDWEK